jgi:glutathione S-transferase
LQRPILHGEKNCIDQKDKDGVFEAYGFLEAFLDGKKWVAGDAVSIADYSLISSVNSLNALIPIDPKKYPRVSAWFKRCEELPEYEANRMGLEGFTTYFENKLAQV